MVVLMLQRPSRVTMITKPAEAAGVKSLEALPPTIPSVRSGKRPHASPAVHQLRREKRQRSADVARSIGEASSCGGSKKDTRDQRHSHSQRPF